MRASATELARAAHREADVIVVDCRLESELILEGLSELFAGDEVVFLDEGPAGHGLVETVDLFVPGEGRR